MDNKGIFPKLIIPSSSSPTLARPDLEARLSQALITKSLVFVVAGAGYGKTELLSKLFQKQSGKVAWTQLSFLDNIVARFWDHFLEGFRQISRNGAERLSSLGFPDGVIAFESFLTILTDCLRPGSRYFLIFDDFHIITNPVLSQFFNNLLEALPGNITLIIISRKLPNLQIPRGSMDDKSIEMVSEEDLRFNRQEIDDYFTLHGIRLTEEYLDEITKETNGWILSLYLISLYLKENQVASIPMVALKPDIFMLIDQQIFAPLEAELKELLIKLSLLETIPDKLLLDLTNNNLTVINQLLEASSFIRHDKLSGALQIHHLFLEFLTAKQHALARDEFLSFYAQVAEWYDQQGALSDAVGYYMLAEKHKEVINTFFTISCRYSTRTANWAIEVLDEIISIAPQLLPLCHLLQGRFHLNNFMIAEAFEKLASALQQFSVLEDTSQNQELLGEAYLLLGITQFTIYAITFDDSFLNTFQEAEKRLPQGSKMYRKHSLQLNAGNYLNLTQSVKENSLYDFEQVMKEALPYISKLTHGTGTGAYELLVAERSFWQRDFETTEIMAFDGIAKAFQKEQYDMENMGIFYLIRMYFAQGNYQKIPDLLTKLKNISEFYSAADAYMASDIIEGWFYAMTDQPEKAAKWLLEDALLSNDSPVDFTPDFLIRARLLMCQNRLAEAVSVLNNHTKFLEKSQQSEDFLLYRIEQLTLLAVMYYQQGNKNDSLKYLEEAYNLSYPNQLVMQFIECGNAMRSLSSYALRNYKQHAIPHDWLDKIHSRASTYAKKQATIIKQLRQVNQNGTLNENPSLSKRELQVLSDLCFGLSREEIADNCDLSVNTVRSILSSIFTKLGATNSLDAVRIATRLGLL